MRAHRGAPHLIGPMIGSWTPASADYNPPIPPWEWNWEPSSIWEEEVWEPEFDETVLAMTLENLVFAIALDVIFNEPDSFETDVFSPGGYIVGWSQPPHPIDWIPSVDPRSSQSEKARAVLYDYFHDDNLRGWFDKDSVKRAFGVKNTADYDPIALIMAYENKSDPVWQKLGRHAETSWNELNKNVNLAIKKRLKLGPLPQSSYSTHPGPVVIYYYDNDRMKKIVYPTQTVVPALQDHHTWWKVDGVHTHETQNPQAIAAERSQPGDPGGGKWGDEGFDFAKDFGQVGAVFGTIMQVVGSIIQVIPGVGTAVGSALIAAGAATQQVMAAIGDAMLGADNAAALAGLAQVVLKVAGNAGFHLPPDYAQALSQTINMVAAAVSAAQKKYTNFSELWGSVAQKADQLGHLGDQEAETIAKILGENDAGKFFIDGYTVGKFAKLEQIEAIAEIVKGYQTFVQDPKALNFFLLGAGIGHLTSVQSGARPPPIRKSTSQLSPSAATRKQKRTSATSGTFRTGAYVRAGADAAREALDEHVGMLASRYAVGEEKRTWEAAAWGCPVGYWRDPLSGECLPRTPICPLGKHFDFATGACIAGGPWW